MYTASIHQAEIFHNVYLMYTKFIHLTDVIQIMYTCSLYIKGILTILQF